VTIDAVVAGVDLAALEPFEAGCIAGIQDLIPVLVPGQQVGIFLETVGEIVQAEPVVNAFVRHVGLGDKFWTDNSSLLPSSVRQFAPLMFRQLLFLPWVTLLQLKL
jgi:hypothetical protein